VLLLLTLPLALVPYVPAFYRALKLTGSDGVLLLSLALPAIFVNAVAGQNGTLTVALLGGGLLLLDRRPAVAGILFGRARRLGAGAGGLRLAGGQCIGRDILRRAILAAQ
jgi:hypothetical protein